MKFHGAARVFNSGSVAHGTANDPVNDADCGVVLDRRSYPELGPDGDQVGPLAVVPDVEMLVAAAVKAKYPGATVTTTKRAIVIEFHQPIDDEDPSVDLIVGLTRAAGALWIPHLDDNRWDASDPEEHTALLAGPPADLRIHRARVLRLAKAAIRNDRKPIMCSFNVEALALGHVDRVRTLGESLALLLARASSSIATELTPDPAGVSEPIKLPEGVTQEDASRRLGFFADRVEKALAARGDRAKVLTALGDVFPKQLPDAPRSRKANIADELRRDERAGAVVTAFGPHVARAKPTRSFGTLR